MDKGKALMVEEELDEPRTWSKDMALVIGVLDERERSDSGTMPGEGQARISVPRMEIDMGTPTVEIYKSFRGEIVRHPISDEKWGKEQGKVKEKRKEVEEEGRSRKRLVIPKDIAPSFTEKVELKSLRYNNGKLDLKLIKG
ncbi:hypothetical protein ACLOJK_037143 [Asimina triloba]